MTKDETIDKLCENSNHGTRREDVEAAYNAGAEAEREACAALCETLPLTMDPHKYTSPGERHLMAVVEAGCRGTFADAIRMRSNELNSGAAAASCSGPLE
jgi:hypothetical protein